MKIDNPDITSLEGTDNTLVRVNGTVGKVQTTGIAVDDSDNLSGVNDITMTGDIIGDPNVGTASGVTRPQTDNSINLASCGHVTDALGGPTTTANSLIRRVGTNQKTCEDSNLIFDNSDNLSGLNDLTGTGDISGFVDITGTGDITGFNYIEAGGVEPDIFIVTDQKTTGTDGGSSTGGSFVTRVLNAILYEKDSVSGFSLSSNQITMNEGKYRVIAEAPAYEVSRHKVVFTPVVGTGNGITGSSRYSDPLNVHGVSTIDDVIEITSATATYELQHYTQTTVASRGFGIATSAGFTFEYYSRVTIIRLGD